MALVTEAPGGSVIHPHMPAALRDPSMLGKAQFLRTLQGTYDSELMLLEHKTCDQDNVDSMSAYATDTRRHLQQ